MTREWWRIQFGLLRCGGRLIAAVVTGNEVAFEVTVVDIEQLHTRWHAINPNHERGAP